MTNKNSNTRFVRVTEAQVNEITRMTVSRMLKEEMMAERAARHNQLQESVDKMVFSILDEARGIAPINEYHQEGEGTGWMGLRADDEDWTLVNTPEDGDTLYGVKIWPGSGYFLDLYKVYADADDYEGVLCNLVVYLENTNNNAYFCDEFINDEVERMRSEGMSEDDIYDEIETYGDIYIDATGVGAKEPHWIIGENLQIMPWPNEERQVKEEQITEDNEKGSEVFTISAQDIVNEESIEDMQYTAVDYHTEEEAIDAARTLAQSLVGDDRVIIVTVFAGEYEDGNGNVLGEPYDIYAISNKDEETTKAARQQANFVSDTVDEYVG